MHKKHILLIAAALAVLAGVFAVVAAANRRPAVTGGKYERNVTDRVTFIVEPTSFTFDGTGTGEEAHELRFTLRAKKNEADFYAVLHSAVLEGLDYTSVTFQTAGGDKNYVPNELPLPAENGIAEEIVWQVTVLLGTSAPEEKEFSLILHYTSGLTPETADEHYLEIPLKITSE